MARLTGSEIKIGSPAIIGYGGACSQNGYATPTRHQVSMRPWDLADTRMVEPADLLGHTEPDRFMRRRVRPGSSGCPGRRYTVSTRSLFRLGGARRSVSGDADAA
jgi:hypothetical protein